MSITYTISKYKFIEPKQITENEYNIIKQKLQNDPNFTLLDEEETITNEFSFKNLVYLFLGGIAGITLGRIIGGKGPDYGENIITKFGFILMFAGTCCLIISFFGLIFALPSMFNFANYIRKKRNYFERFEMTIRNSSNYVDFRNSFYK